MSRARQAASVAAAFALSLSAGAAAAVMLTSGSATAGTGTHIRIEEVEKIITLSAGGKYTLPSACAAGEAVTGGGPTKVTPGLSYLVSAPFFDGVGSGWSVTYRNTKSTAQTLNLGTAALCVAPGYITP